MPDEYIIPLSIDVAGVVQKAQTVSTSLKDVGTAASKAGADAKKGFEDAAKGAGDLGNKVVDSSQKVNQLTKTVQQLEIQLQSYQRVAKTSLDPNVVVEYNKKVQALQDQISKLSNAGKTGFDDFGNAVKKSGNFLQDAFTGLRRIAQILPGIGLAGLFALGFEAIGKAAEALGVFNTKLTVSQENLKNLNEVNQNAGKQFGEQATNLRILYTAATDVNNAEHDRILAARELQKEFPDTFRNIQTETILNGGAADSYEKLTADILDNAKAHAALTKIQELAGKQLEDDLKVQRILLANANENARVKPVTQVSRDGAVELLDPNLQAASVRAQKQANDARAEENIKATKLNKQSLQDQIDFLTKFAGGNDKLAQSIALKDTPKTKDQTDEILARRKALLDQLTKLQNDFNSSEIASIEDAETKEVAQNDVNFQNKIRTLQQQQKDLIEEAKKNKFPSLAPLIQDNIREISLLIAKEEEERQAADLAIIAKYAALKLKAQQDSIRAIGVLLKDETQARVDAINANFDKVIIEAKKNGVLTTDIEKKLAQQRQSDISDVESKAILDRLTRDNELQVAFIEAQGRRPGELQATFDDEQQRAILANDLEFQKKRIAILSATLAINGALTPDQTKQLSDAAKKLNQDQGKTQSNSEADKANIFKALGIDNDTAANVRKYGDAASQIGKITSDLFSNLEQGAEAQVSAIQKQIDAINSLLQADQNAVDKQQALFDKGRANSLDAAKKQLADDQANKAKLQKQAEDAQKKANDLKKAELVADSISQVSNLITAATEIYKSVSVIPVIGPALAFATVAAMFTSFAVAKTVAFNSVNSQSAEDGGIVGGDRHSTGGNKYMSMDGKDRNILEIERGERIFSRKNTEKHKALFEAIQNNDYSKLDINDVSIRDLLRGTGVMQQLEVAKRTGNQNITLQDRANVVVVNNGNSDKYLSSIDRKMDKLDRKEPLIIDYGDYIWIDYGNGHTEKKYK